MWERWTGVGKNYDPVADKQDQIRDMRRDWEGKQMEKERSEDGKFDADDDFDLAVHEHFTSTRNNSTTKIESHSSDDHLNEKHEISNNPSAV